MAPVDRVIRGYLVRAIILLMISAVLTYVTTKNYYAVTAVITGILSINYWIKWRIATRP